MSNKIRNPGASRRNFLCGAAAAGAATASPGSMITKAQSPVAI